MTAPELVVVGVIRQPHGVRGEMKVQPLTDFPEDRLASPGIRFACFRMSAVAALWSARVGMCREC